MSDPYRQSSKPAETSLRKYMRLKARIRGLWRRVVGPTIMICVIGAIFMALNFVTCDVTQNKEKDGDAINKRHFDDWQKMIDDNQAKMNVRQVEMDKREAELNARVRNFEDMVSMAPTLMKNGDTASVNEALKRVKVR